GICRGVPERIDAAPAQPAARIGAGRQNGGGQSGGANSWRGGGVRLPTQVACRAFGIAETGGLSPGRPIVPPRRSALHPLGRPARTPSDPIPAGPPCTPARLHGSVAAVCRGPALS